MMLGRLRLQIEEKLHELVPLLLKNKLLAMFIMGEKEYDQPAVATAQGQPPCLAAAAAWLQSPTQPRSQVLEPATVRRSCCWVLLRMLLLPLCSCLCYCSSFANLGNLILNVLPAICYDGSLFGSDYAACSTIVLSYASFSMAIFGLTFGAITWLKDLVIGDGAPFRVIQDYLKLLGDGLKPCTILILGGNLLQDPLYHFVLLLQFTLPPLPPTMAIGTMTQFFDVGQEECSGIMLWTYIVAAPALTFWTTVFMSILS